MPAAILWALVAGAAVSVGGCLWTLAARRRRARVLGRDVWRGSRTRAWRVAFTLADLALMAVAFTQDSVLVAPTLVLLVAALASVWLSPGSEEGVCGEGGVAVGWDAARFGELAEWRLIGDHLRFRTTGEWRAVELPRSEHAAMRARLTACCAERESVFSRGGAT